MSRALLWMVLAVPQSGPIEASAPMQWSPDGQWIAYTSTARPIEMALQPGWLFQDLSPDSLSNAPSSPETLSPEDFSFRLWATRADNSASVLLEEGAGPLTSPGWSPDGQSLAFGRLISRNDGTQHYELVSQSGLDRQRVLFEKALEAPPTDELAKRLPGRSVAWSPDGQNIAAPSLSPNGLMILRAESGRTIQVIEAAYGPSWSPDGSRLAFYREKEPGQVALEYINIETGTGELLAEVDAPTQPPTWARDGESLLYLRGRIDRQKERQFELARISLNTGAVAVVKEIGHSVSPGENFLGVSFAFGNDELEQYYALAIENRDAAISYHRGRMPMDFFHPLDGPTPLGALSISPDGKSLALRLGPPGPLATPAICDLSNRKLKLLAPDNASRAEWIAVLVESVRGLVATRVPPPMLEGKPAERPTLLPLPGEIVQGEPGWHRLREVARLGKIVSEPKQGDEETFARRIPEVRLLFQYLLEENDDALLSLKELEPTLSEADHRLRLLGLRAQIDLALGLYGRAQPTIEYLLRARSSRRSLIEPIGDGGLLIVEPDDSRVSWPEYLAHHARQLTEGSIGEQIPFESIPRGPATGPQRPPDPAMLREIERLLNPDNLAPPDPPIEPNVNLELEMERQRKRLELLIGEQAEIRRVPPNIIVVPDPNVVEPGRRRRIRIPEN